MNMWADIHMISRSSYSLKVASGFVSHFKIRGSQTTLQFPCSAAAALATFNSQPGFPAHASKRDIQWPRQFRTMLFSGVPRTR